MERWHNKVAIVTGAGAGIGAACCKALLASGMLVVGLDINCERLENELKSLLPPAQQKRFYVRKCDVTQEHNILDNFKWVEENFGGVDVLINNAGIARKTQLVTPNNTAHLKAILDTNVLAAAICAREAFQSMKKRAFDGHIVLLNSLAGHEVTNIPGVPFNIYPCSKYAITAMTEVLRQEFLLHQTKIKVTSISPAAVYTDILSDDFKKLIREKNLPFLKPEDVADAIVYCLQTPPHVQIHELTIRPIGGNV